MPITTRAARAEDAAAIADIYNQGIADRGATFETEPRTRQDIQSRMADARFPLLVAEDAGTVVGWAGLSSYRSRACYAGIAEFSIYLDRGTRGHGVGRLYPKSIPPAMARTSHLTGQALAPNP